MSVRLRTIGLAALTLALAAASAASAKAKPPSPSTPACAGPQSVAPDAPAAEADFGCATLRELQMMLADPADLRRGRAGGPPQGDGAVAAVQRYRAGQIKPLGDASTSTVGANVGAGAPPAPPPGAP